MELSISSHFDYGRFTTDPPPNDVKEDDRKGLMKKLFPTGFKFELVALLKYSWPIILTMFLNIFIRIMPIMFTGHLGQQELDAASMGLSLANLIGTSIGIGMIAACDTLFSQSFGSENKGQVGIYLQTAIYVCTLSCVVSWGVLMNTNNILLILGQDPTISKYTEDYLFIFMPAIYFIFLYQLVTRYLQVQGIVFPSVVIGLVCNIITAILQYLLIYTANMGLRGSATAILLGYLSLASFVTAYAYFSGAYRKTWTGWSREALQDWGQFMKLGLSSISMVCLEWWTFEVSMFLMGILGTVEMGANSIMYQIWMLYSGISLGMSSACAFRIGCYLGQKNSAGAITAARVSFVIAFSLACCTAIITLSLSHYLPMIFTSDPEVLHMARPMIFILALFSFFGAAKNVCAGIVRGTGKQVAGGIITFFAYFVFAMPIGISLMFLTSTRASGFWWGLIIGMAIACTAFLVMVMHTDWEREVVEALIRAKVTKRATHNAKDDVVASGTKSTEYGTASLTSQNTKYSKGYWTRLALFRACITLACLGLFAFGVLSRFVLFIPPPIPETWNYTLPNSTAANASFVI